jgi:dolichol-phosphate mannosyltransferase
MATPPLLSIVAPAYRCADCLPELHRRVREALAPLTDHFELVLVDDASPGEDWVRIQELAAQDPRVKGIRFSRNFGQHHAITAGVDHARGDWVVVMDADLQDRPEEIPRLYQKAVAEGFDVVFGRRMERTDGFLKVFLSRCFNKLINSLSNIPIDPAVGNFSIASRQVIDAYNRLRETSRAYGLGILWCGFRVGYLPIEHGARFAGDSAYTLGKAMQLALESITSLSTRPLRLAINVGFTMAGIALAYGLYLIARFLLWGIPVAGWTSMMVSVYFLSGVILAFLGILGLYVGKIFEEVKGRPLYVVRTTLNL